MAPTGSSPTIKKHQQAFNVLPTNPTPSQGNQSTSIATTTSTTPSQKHQSPSPGPSSTTNLDQLVFLRRVYQTDVEICQSFPPSPGWLENSTNESSDEAKESQLRWK
ncbi:hypothetical protein Pmani_009281 [Petrolisthes manimaculis]|uniref:Uncharacterized protein n=1 Tax=Petrolisthes manimaculis TaxID=1843537 RepID=A0AAE1Q3T1_9EUCA|nr:hypothetical protein Pmani_009281 [Petrolisthes manimaculis]